MAGGIRSLIIALLCLLWLIVRLARRHHAQLERPSATQIHHRLLKPRHADDCPTCRRPPVQVAPAPPAPPPWRELKSRRGAPKRIATDGFACPNRACAYHGITDADIHALVGDGTHGKHEH